MNYDQYLPKTKERLIRLSYIINKRPVAILLPGTSILELENRIGDLGSADVCYASVNDFWIMEDKILSQIGKRLSIVQCSAVECNVPSVIHNDYMARDDDNVFITEKVSFHRQYIETLERYDRKLLFFAAERGMSKFFIPSRDNPLHFWAQATFSILMCIILIGKPDSIFLFGADGGKIGDDLYYGGWNSDSEMRLQYDTILLNKTFSYMFNMTVKTHGVPSVPVINVSPNSHYTAFNKMDYDTAIKVLNERANESRTEVMGS